MGNGHFNSGNSLSPGPKYKGKKGEIVYNAVSLRKGTVPGLKIMYV